MKRLLLTAAGLALLTIPAHAFDGVTADGKAHAEAWAAVTPMTSISGPARIIDGDTVVVAGIHVRLKGVDAAELGTARGEHAKQVMIGIVGSDLTWRLTGEKT